MGAYRTVIGCNFNQYENNSTTPDRYLILDIQDDLQVNNSATIASQPMQDGDTMSDHMYRNPTEITLSGSFSMNGKNWDDDTYNFLTVGDRLTNIQEVFEKILNEGILCTLTTIQEEDSISTSNGVSTVSSSKNYSKNRFKIRKNMALKTVNWTQGQNTMKFQFSFNEIIMVEEQEQYEVLTPEQIRELGLPSVNSPQGSNLGSLMIETGQVPEVIIKSLYNNGYIEKEFLQMLADVGKIYIGIIIVKAVVAVCIGASIAVAAATASAMAAAGITTATVGASIFPVGTIVIGALLVVAGIGLAISKIFKTISNAIKRRKAFKLINKSCEQDGMKLKNLIDDVVQNLNKLQTGLTIYNINGNYEQQVLLTIAGYQYVINFTKNNATSEEHTEWIANVVDMDGNMVDTYNNWCPVANIADLDRNKNLWFRDTTKQFEVYLVNPSLDPQVNDTQEKIDYAKEHLDSYSIWVSDGDVKAQVEKVWNCINETLINQGFN